MKDMHYSVPRPFVVTLLNRRHEAKLTRRFGYLDTAVGRAEGIMIAFGEVGDILVVHHDVTGMEIGTVKLLPSGGMRSEWAWTKELRSQCKIVKEAKRHPPASVAKGYLTLVA